MTQLSQQSMLKLINKNEYEKNNYFILLCLFGVLSSGHCQEKRLLDHYYLTVMAIKEGNISGFEKQRKTYKEY